MRSEARIGNLVLKSKPIKTYYSGFEKLSNIRMNKVKHGNPKMGMNYRENQKKKNLM